MAGGRDTGSANQPPSQTHLAARTMTPANNSNSTSRKRPQTFTREEMQRVLLHQAVLSKSVEAARAVLDAGGADVNGRDDTLRHGALHYAAAHGDEAMMLHLIENGAKINVANSVGWSPLHYAVLGGFAKIVEMLLNRNAWPCYRDNYMVTPLHVACACGSPAASSDPDYHVSLRSVMLLLLEYGGRKAVSAADEHGQTPLHVAAACGNLQSVQILLLNGADPQARDAGLNTPGRIWRTEVPRGVRKEIKHLLATTPPPRVARITPGTVGEPTAFLEVRQPPQV